MAAVLGSAASSTSSTSSKVSDSQAPSTSQPFTPIVPRVSSLIKALESKAAAAGAGGDDGAGSMRPRVSPWPRAPGSLQSEDSGESALRKWSSPRTAAIARQDGA
jgi:hypothetical protein